MEGKHELVNGKSPQPNKLWAQGQADPDSDSDSFSVSWAWVLLLERKRIRETVSKMNHSARTLLVKEKNNPAKYERPEQKLDNVSKILIPKTAPLSSLRPTWPVQLPKLSLQVALPQFRSGFARDTAYNTAAQPAL